MQSHCSDPEIHQEVAGASQAEPLKEGVSWVIPVRNEARSVKALVDGIQSQTVQPDEVIIVDGGSVDETVSLLKEMTVDDPRFIILEAEDATPGLGRNIGIKAARYSWVALTDAGTKIPSNWLEEMLSIRDSSSEFEVVYGHYEPIVESHFDEWASLVYVPPKVTRKTGRLRGPSIASTLLKKEVWKHVGGFPDLRASEDRIFMEQIEKENIPTGWAPKAVIHWHIQPDFKSTFRRFYFYSKHNVWAGRQSGWHYGVARIYFILALFLLLAVFHHPAWLIVLFAVWGARVFKTVLLKKEEHSLFWALNPVRLAGVSLVMFTIDIAMYSGWVQALASLKSSSDNCTGKI